MNWGRRILFISILCSGWGLAREIQGDSDSRLDKVRHAELSYLSVRCALVRDDGRIQFPYWP